MKSIENIIDFWFSEQAQPMWFNATPEFDQQLRDDVEDTFIKAKKKELDEWQATAEGSLALVILLDQIPLNIYRGQASAFATEAQARMVAQNAIDQGLDKQLNKPQKMFLYLPFMHSENLRDQDFAVALFTLADMEENVRYANHHRDIVKRFGRFPHRNTILGRESSEEELAYLNSKEAFLG